MKNTVKVIGFNSAIIEKYIAEAKEVEYLDREINKKRIFGWKPKSVVNQLKKAIKWNNNGWYTTPLMRSYIETHNLF